VSSVRLKTVAAICLTVVVFATGAALAENVCPPPKPVSEGEDDARMKEEHFGWGNFGQALEYIDRDLPQALLEKEKTEDVRMSESYLIGHPNVVKTMKGFVLRQEALLRRAERDLARERGRRGGLSKANVKAAEARFEGAKRAFCEFLKNAYYTD
jgi:hypothetical protein